MHGLRTIHIRSSVIVHPKLPCGVCCCSCCLVEHWPCLGYFSIESTTYRRKPMPTVPHSSTRVFRFVQLVVGRYFTPPTMGQCQHGTREPALCAILAMAWRLAGVEAGHEPRRPFPGALGPNAGLCREGQGVLCLPSTKLLTSNAPRDPRYADDSSRPAPSSERGNRAFLQPGPGRVEAG